MQSACYKNNRKYSIIYKNKFVAVRTDPTTYLHFVTLFPFAALLTLGCSFPAASHTYGTTTTNSGVSLHCSSPQTTPATTSLTHHSHRIQLEHSENYIKTKHGYYGTSPSSRNTVKGEILLSVTIRLPDLSWNCSAKHLLYKRTWLNMDG